jgi:hypothetical protein
VICQRWRDKRTSYRPAGEPIDPRRYEVAIIDRDGPARAFVEAHHYSGTYPAARARFGLYQGPELVGVAVFSVPMRPEVLRPFPTDLAAELGRFVLLDSVPGNGETWFLARCLDVLRGHGWAGIVSLSDPCPRPAADGALTFRGHVGTIYQASSAIYAGRATARTLRLLPDGRTFSDRAAQKIRAREVGWRYAVEQLRAAGAAEPGNDLRAWLKTWLPRVTRPLRHPGNHRYLLPLDRAARKLCPPPQAYPKQVDLPLLARAA